MLASGLAGVEEDLAPIEPFERDTFSMTDEERREAGIGDLPTNLGEAISSFAASEIMRETLGPHLFEHFIKVKIREHREYSAHVSSWETENLLPLL